MPGPFPGPVYARACVPSSVFARTYQLKVTPTWWHQANPWGKKSHRTDLEISSLVSLMTRMVRCFNLHGELGSCVRNIRGYIAPCFFLFSVSLPPRLVVRVRVPLSHSDLFRGSRHVPVMCHTQFTASSCTPFHVSSSHVPWPLPRRNSVTSSFFIPF